MKNFYLLVLGVTVITIIRLVWTKEADEKVYKVPPKINDCYIYQFKSQNPFKTYRIDTIRILDVRENYLKYKRNDGFISSDEIDYIMKYAIKTDSCNCL